MGHSASLYKTKLSDNTTAWLFQMQMRRLIYVVLDTTDSCAPEHKKVEDFLKVLVDILQAGDCCSFWMLTPESKIYVIKWTSARNINRHQTVQEIISRLRLIDTGTWIQATIKSMTEEALEDSSPGDQTFFLIVSDGEIFDVEAVDFSKFGNAPPGLIRIGDRLSRQLEFLQHNSTVVQPTPASLKNFLSRRELLVTAKNKQDYLYVRRFSSDGELLPPETDSIFRIKGDQSFFGLAFAGEQQPQISFKYAGPGDTANKRAWNDLPAICEELPAAGLDRLNKVISHFDNEGRVSDARIHWDLDRLKKLAFESDAGNLKFECPANKRHRRVFAIQDTLYCSTCTAMLLTTNGVERNKLPYKGIVCFRIHDAGVDEELTEGEDTGDHTFRIIKRDDRQIYLFLDLGRH